MAIFPPVIDFPFFLSLTALQKKADVLPPAFAVRYRKSMAQAAGATDEKAADTPPEPPAIYRWPKGRPPNPGFDR